MLYNSEVLIKFEALQLVFEISCLTQEEMKQDFSLFFSSLFQNLDTTKKKALIQ